MRFFMLILRCFLECWANKWAKPGETLHRESNEALQPKMLHDGFLLLLLLLLLLLRRTVDVNMMWIPLIANMPSNRPRLGTLSNMPPEVYMSGHHSLEMCFFFTMLQAKRGSSQTKEFKISWIFDRCWSKEIMFTFHLGFWHVNMPCALHPACPKIDIDGSGKMDAWNLWS